MNLSPHFTLGEMTVTHSSHDNTPTEVQVEALKKLCENILEPLREHFGLPIIVTSGFRSPKVNVEFGGADNSEHLFGEAADIHIPGVANADIWRFIDGSDLEFDQLIAEKLSETDGAAGWIHVSYRPESARKQAFSFDGENYLSGLHFA